MHQIISTILLFTIGISSSGFTLAKHFCGDSLAEVQLNQVVKSCCSDPGEMPDDRCHNELEQALLDSFSQDIKIQILPVFVLLADFVLTNYLEFLPQIIDHSGLPASNHSPPVPISQVYLWVQCFLI